MIYFNWAFDLKIHCIYHGGQKNAMRNKNIIITYYFMFMFEGFPDEL